ncbi:hypothetical protein ABB05_18985 [Lederbergia galactosidilytica]|uniref:Uncharacterized protein n=1 Tax=Lederbergia galactosidilytica TaxID=217031 RepID=A0A177ZJL2_9BACI|nr:hypothetical protein ABB05_18985 [Lederbergia galactosidilytica]
MISLLLDFNLCILALTLCSFGIALQLGLSELIKGHSLLLLRIQNLNVGRKKENSNQSVNRSKNFGLAFFWNFPKDTEGVGKVVEYV